MKQHKLNDEKIDLIINAAYGNLSLSERIRIFFLLKNNQEAKKLYSEYKKTSELVKGINPVELPTSVSEKVKSKIGLKKENGRSVLNDFYSLIIMKPIASGLTAVLLVITLTTSLLINHNRKIEYDNYSRLEVEQAENQAKQAFAIIGSVLNKTSEKVKQEILTETVSTELNKGLEIVNQLFTKGDRNEN